MSKKNYKDELPIGGLVPDAKEGDDEQLIGDVEPAAVPGDFDGVACDSPETALQRVFCAKESKRKGLI